jgi:hypothetical protein
VSVAAYDPALALVELRRARFQKRLGDVHWIDLLYQAYITAIVGGMVVLFLSSFVGDGDLDAAGVARVRADGPALLGIVVALAAAVGLRSGSRGGPLALEAAEVRHVLLAPVDRRLALRGPAWRQVRFNAFCGMVAGAIAGQLAVRRLPGAPIAWVASGAAFGVVTAALAMGLALAASGTRLARWIATLASGVLVAWAVADASDLVPRSPTAWLGTLALWPLHVEPIALIPTAVAAGALVLGFRWLGAVSIEAAERRSSLVGQLRFAATLQDIRTVIVLRRQLAMELPRVRPYLRARVPGGRVFPVWGRGWRGVLRWPAARVGRLVVLGVVAGLSLRGVWSGTTPLIVVAGLALFVAGLDAVEPLAQETDHPERRDTVPLPAGELGMRHLPVPVVVMVLVGLPAALAAVVAAPSVLAVEVAAIALLPGALGAVGGATTSVVMGAPAQSDTWQLLPPEVSGMRLAARTAWPPLLAIIGVGPVLLARAAVDADFEPIPIEAGAAAFVAVVFAFVVAWVRFREPAKAWWAAKLEEVMPTKPGRDPEPAVAAASKAPPPAAPPRQSSTSGPHKR